MPGCTTLSRGIPDLSAAEGTGSERRDVSPMTASPRTKLGVVLRTWAADCKCQRYQWFRAYFPGVGGLPHKAFARLPKAGLPHRVRLFAAELANRCGLQS